MVAVCMRNPLSQLYGVHELWYVAQGIDASASSDANRSHALMHSPSTIYIYIHMYAVYSI